MGNKSSLENELSQNPCKQPNPYIKIEQSDFNGAISTVVDNNVLHSLFSFQWKIIRVINKMQIIK